MPVTAPQVQLAPRHLSSTTLTAPLSNSALQLTVASGAILDSLPTAALLTDGVSVEVVSVDSLASGTTYNITRAIEPGMAAATFPANTTQVKLVVAAETMRRLQRGFAERTGGTINVREYGAQGDATTVTGSVSAAANTLTGSSFAAPDVGTGITITGAGAAGADFTTTINTRSSSSVVLLTAPAGTTVARALATWGSGKTSRVAVTAGSTTCTLVGPWTPADVGKPVVIQQAGGSLTIPLVTTIIGWTSGTQVTLANNAAGSVVDMVLTYGTDDTAAIRAALASIPAGRGGRVTIPPGTYMLTGTLNIPSHCEFWGASAAQVPRLLTDLDLHAGTCLVWAGPTAVLPTVMPMVRLFDVQGVIVHGIVCNGENVPGVAGFLLDSDNAISAQENTLEYFACWNCPVGIQWGHATDTSAGQNTQIDTVNLRRFWMAAPNLTSSAVGIIIQSSNTQISRIEHGIFQSMLRGIHFQRHGGITTIDRCIAGAVGNATTAPNGTVFQTSPFCGELLFTNCQAEGCTYFLRALDRINDADPVQGQQLNAITLLCCHLDTPILVTGGQTIITIGCSNSGPVNFTYNNNGNIISIGDALYNTWNLTGTPAPTLYKLCTFLGPAYTVSGIPETVLPNLQVGGGAGTAAIWKKHLTATLAIPTTSWPASIATGSGSAVNIICPGTVPGDTCIATPDQPMPVGLVWNAYGAPGNQVTLRMNNLAGAQPVPSATWRVTVLGY